MADFPDFMKNVPRHHDFMQHVPKHREPASQPKPNEPQNLLDFYLMGNYEPLYRDAEERPKHYDQRQHQLIQDLKRGKRPGQQDLDLLMYRYTERTEPAERRSEILRRAQKPKQEHNTAAQKKGGPSFEKQDYGKLIRVI